jgi:hypothetical protein
MKTLRISLTLLAIVVGIGGAIGSTYMTSNTYYEHVVMGDDFCIPRLVEFACQPTPTNAACQISVGSAILRDSDDTETACGTELWKTP